MQKKYVPQENNYIGVREIQKESSLHDFINIGYEGLGSIYTSDDLPKELFEFIESQFKRFNVPLPPFDLIRDGAWEATVAVNNWEPYAFFYGHTDVVLSEEWQTCTFEILDDDNKPVELDPENLETYKLIPNNDQRFFDYVMANPGLNNMSTIVLNPDGSRDFDDFYGADMIESSLTGVDIHDESIIDRTSEKVREWLIEHSPKIRNVPFIDIDFNKQSELYFWDEDEDARGDCPKSGKWERAQIDLKAYMAIKSGSEHKWVGSNLTLDMEYEARFSAEHHNYKVWQTRMDYFRLAAWATIAWMFGPYARDFRYRFFNIFEACYKEGAEGGECIMYSGTVYERKYYTKTERPARSCYVCGLSSWCVETTYIEGTTRYLCEKHVNGNIPTVPPMNCGTRSCRYTECAHHVYHGRKDAKALVYRDYGSLSRKVKENRLLAQASDPEQLKLLN